MNCQGCQTDEKGNWLCDCHLQPITPTKEQREAAEEIVDRYQKRLDDGQLQFDITEAVALLLASREKKAFKDGQDKQAFIERAIMEDVGHLMPMGVSQWREYGKKFGYWEYFEKEVAYSASQEVVRAVEEQNKYPEKMPHDKSPSAQIQWRSGYVTGIKNAVSAAKTASERYASLHLDGPKGSGKPWKGPSEETSA